MKNSRSKYVDHLRIAGNFRLRTWAATSLRKAGLCGDHFDETCFTNATRKALRRNVVPRHYTEDLKFRNSNNESNINDEIITNDADSENNDDPMNVDESSSSIDESGVEEHRMNDVDVEFIVEELDESLIDEQSQPVVGEFIEEEVEDEMEEEKIVIEDNNQQEESCLIFQKSELSPMRFDKTEQTLIPIPDNSGLIRVNRTDSNVRTYYRSKSHHPQTSDEYSRVKLEMASEESETPVTDDEIVATASPSTIAFRDETLECTNPRHAKMLMNLRDENKELKRSMRLLKQNLRRAKAREVHYMKVREMLKNIDVFLEIQECRNPVARAMVKLALHKRKTPYTQEEKHFATQLYRHSSTAFIRLRRAGCNFPGKSTIKRWIADDHGQTMTFNFITAHEDEADDGTDDDVCEGAEYTDTGVLGTIVNNENEVETLVNDENETEVLIGGENVVDNGFNEAVEDAEDAIDTLVEHLEEQIVDSRTYEEYVEELPPDDYTDENLK